MTGYIQLYSGAEVNEQELSDFETNFITAGGVVRQAGVLGLAAAQLSPLNGRRYNVTTGGKAYVPNSNYVANGTNPAFWLVRLSGAIEELSFAANSSGSTRIDLICIKVDTGVGSANPDNTGVVSLVVVQGNPGGGVPATPDNHLALYQVTCANGFTQIVDANVTDVRVEPTVNMPYDAILAKHLGALQGFGMINGKLSVTVSGNNITVAVKTLSGADPSAENPVKILIGTTIRKITAALSVTRNAGTNWFGAGGSQFATKEADYFVYLAWDASNSVVRIGFAPFAHAELYSDFSSTSTDRKYGAFNTNPSATDEVVNVGRFAATLSASASFNWSVPTFTNKNLKHVPIYESRELDYAPTFTGDGSMTYTSVITRYAKYQITGRLCRVRVDTQGTTGGSASNAIKISIPFASIQEASSSLMGNGSVIDTGLFEAGLCFISVGDPSLGYFRKVNSANFGLSTNDAASGRFEYPI